MAKKQHKHLTEKDFDNIKTLLSTNLTTLQVSQLSQRSRTTVYAIRQADDFDAYKDIVRSYTRNKTKKEPAEETVVEAPKEQEAQRTNFNPDSANLARIATALERLADAWESTPNKRRLF